MTANSRGLSEAIPPVYDLNQPAPRRGASKRRFYQKSSGNGINLSWRKQPLVSVGLFLAFTAATAAVARAQTGGESMNARPSSMVAAPLATYPDTPPKRTLNFLFIHHSVGGQLLAEPGPDAGDNSIYSTHPNGGGLRRLLRQNGYAVHEASYTSRVGHDTDIFHWLPKFQNEMSAILQTRLQDALLSGGESNQIIAFKSCFPNNAFKGEGTAPGNATGPELTLWNAKAAYRALLAEFQKQPGVLFVCVTAPPLAAGPQEAGWKRTLKKAMGRDSEGTRAAQLARQFNYWLASPDGWLSESKPANVVVFNYYEILTAGGETGLSAYPSGNGTDSHPNREGNQRAAAEFAPFLNRAVHRAGLIEP